MQEKGIRRRDKMFCQRCGNEIKEGSRFCAKCGCSIPIDEKNSNKLSECKEKTSQKKKSGKKLSLRRVPFAEVNSGQIGK